MDQVPHQIASRHCAVWIDTRDSEIRAARASGQRAATSDMALLLRRLDDFENGLIGRAKASVLNTQNDLQSYAADLRRQVEDLSRERDDHISQRANELREQKQRVLQSLHNTKGPGSAPYATASKAVEEAEKDLRAIRADVNGRPLRRSMVFVYLPIMIALALVEIPVNRLAFELFFQEQPAISLALAGFVGAVLIFFAHVIGTLTRRMESPSRPAQQARRVAAIAGLLLSAFVLIYFLAKMRQLYVRLLESEQSNNLSAIIEGLTRGGAGSAIKTVTSQDLGTAGWTLLAVNFVLFMFGVTAAFFRHDPHPDYESAWQRQERARRRLTKLRTRFEKENSEKIEQFDRQLASLDQLLRETQVKIDELEAREQGLRPFFDQTVRRVANAVRNRSLAFQEGAIANLPKGPVQGALSDIKALPEDEIKSRITEELPAAA